MSASCCWCDRILFQENGILFCQHCWQKPAGERQPPRILAVDDNFDSLLVISATLESFGFPYVGLSEGLRMIPFLQQYEADLILLDALLTDIDSQALLESLRRNVATQDIPIVAVTALANMSDRERLLSVGFNDYLSKPYQLDDLRRVILKNLPKSSLP
ncbi:response regulator [Acaryochloris thomasi]|nr:response regulator [Acaryochloris thomasi]